MAKVVTFENKKVHKHLHLWPLGPHRMRLAVRAGTSKGSTISQYGCSTFGALATEAQLKEEEEEEENSTTVGGEEMRSSQSSKKSVSRYECTE